MLITINNENKISIHVNVIYDSVMKLYILDDTKQYICKTKIFVYYFINKIVNK